MGLASGVAARGVGAGGKPGHRKPFTLYLPFDTHTLPVMGIRPKGPTHTTRKKVGQKKKK